MSVRQATSSTGMSLLPTMMTVVVLSIALGSYLLLVGHNNRMTSRAQAWKAALPLAEAGIEEALTHLNVNDQREADGWKMDLGQLKLRKSRPMYPGFYEVEVNVALSMLQSPVITARGYAPLPLSTNFIPRTVQVQTKRFGWGGIICRQSVNLMGSRTVLDSYDPTDPTASTLGRYDSSKRRANCFVGTISTVPGNLSIGNHHIYGVAGTGPGGDIQLNNGKVGTTSWNVLSHTAGKVEPGHFRTDVNFLLPMPEPPFTGNAPSPNSGLYLGVNYGVLMTGGNYKKNGRWDFTGEGMVIGPSVLYVNGDVNLNGVLNILPSASLKLYVFGDFDLGSSGHVAVGNGRSDSFQIIGLKERTFLRLTGNQELTAKIYAPGMDVNMVGTSEFYGNVVANSFTLTGAAEFHADESSGALLNKYTIISWREL